jgi:hypothetical protein
MADTDKKINELDDAPGSLNGTDYAITSAGGGTAGRSYKRPWSAILSYIQSALTSIFVSKTGDTMTGLLNIQIATSGGALDLTSTDAGTASGPNLRAYRNSASPAANDGLSSFRFQGNDSLGNRTDYALFNGIILDPTDGSEDGQWEVWTPVAGATARRFALHGGALFGPATGGVPATSGHVNAVDYLDDGVNINTIYAALAGAAFVGACSIIAATNNPLVIQSTTNTQNLSVNSQVLTNLILLTSTGAASSQASNASFRRQRGTFSVPTIVATGDWLGFFGFSGHNGSSLQQLAYVNAVVNQGTPAVGAMGTRVEQWTTRDGATVPEYTVGWQANYGLSVGSVAGLIVDWNRVARHTAGAGDWQTTTPTNGGTTAISNYVDTVLASPAATIAGHTYTMPSDPRDGQKLTIKNSTAAANITAVTHNGNTGQTIEQPLTALNAGAYGTWKYRGSSPTSGTWYRID